MPEYYSNVIKNNHIFKILNNRIARHDNEADETQYVHQSNDNRELIIYAFSFKSI